jgi:hypothetical protein
MCSIPPWCAALVAVLVNLSAPAATVLAQGGDVCANAVQAGIGSTQVAYDTLVCTDTGAPATTQVLVFQPCSSIGADVWFRWTATRTGPTRFALCGASFDCKLGLWRGSQCVSLVPLACNDDSCGLQSELVLPTTLGQEYFIQIGFFTSSYPAGTHVWGAGTLAIDELSHVANDSCHDPMVFLSGVNSLPFDTGSATPSGVTGGGGCFINPWPDVFFEWTASVSGNYEFRTCGANGDTVVAVHRGDHCDAVCENWNDDHCGLQSIAQVVTVNAGETFLVQVAGYQGAGPSGWLEVVPFIPPPCMVDDDDLEPNDLCIDAWTLGDGAHLDLVCRENDNDIFSVVVQPGDELHVVALFNDSLADLDLYLWSAASSALCGTAPPGSPPNNGYLAAAVSVTNNEELTYRNTSNVLERILIEVDFFSVGLWACNEYDLLIDTSRLNGASYCVANPNSTGLTSYIHALGSSLASANDLDLYAVLLPYNAFGYFIVSPFQAFVANAGGAQGNLCVGLSTGRFRSQLGNTGSKGYLVVHVDLTDIPQPNGSVVVQPGQTWNFQCWHRDAIPGNPPLATSNFTSGYSLLFD